jgi:hypothetical protein
MHLDIHEVMTKAAGTTRDLPDVETIYRRGRRIVWRRRATAAAAALALVVGGVQLGQSDLLSDALRRRDVPPAAPDARLLSIGPMDAGRYEVTRMSPRIALDLGPGWSVSYLTNDGFTMSPSGAAGALGVLRVRNVFKPGEKGQTAPAPENLAGWIVDHPDLRIRSTRSTNLGGLPGTQIDATVAASSTTQPCSEPCLAIFERAAATAPVRGDITGFGGVMSLDPGYRVRLIVIGLSEGHLVAYVQAPPASWEGTAARAGEVLTTLRIDG